MYFFNLNKVNFSKYDIKELISGSIYRLGKRPALNYFFRMRIENFPQNNKDFKSTYANTAGIIFFCENSYNYYEDNKFYCFNCKTISDYNFEAEICEPDKIDIRFHNSDHSLRPTKLYCKHCGCEHDLKQKSFYLIANHNACEIPISTTIFNDEDKIKLTSIVGRYEYHNGNVIFNKIFYSIIVSFKTNQSYLRIYNATKRKVEKIINISNANFFYNNIDSSHAVVEKLVSLQYAYDFAKLLIDRLDGYLEHKCVLDNVISKLNDCSFAVEVRSCGYFSRIIDYLITVNRYKLYMPKNEVDMALINSYRRTFSKKIKGNSFDELVFSVKKELKSANKRIKRIIFQEPYKIYVYKFFKRLFSNNDVIADILSIESGYLYALLINYAPNMVSSNKVARDNGYNSLIAMRLMSKKIGEAVAWNKIYAKLKSVYRNTDMLNVGDIRCDREYSMFDTMYYIHNVDKQCKELGIEFPDEVLVGNIDEIHENCRIFCQKLTHVSRKISYVEEELAFIGNINGYDFILPQETMDLVVVGEKMNICVGHLYSAKAYNKHCTIVYVVKDNKYVACIELRKSKNGFSVVQAKGKYNSRIAGELYNTVMEWINKNNLVVNTVDLELQERACSPMGEEIVPVIEDEPAGNIDNNDDDIFALAL